MREHLRTSPRQCKLAFKPCSHAQGRHGCCQFMLAFGNDSQTEAYRNSKVLMATRVTVLALGNYYSRSRCSLRATRFALWRSRRCTRLSVDVWSRNRTSLTMLTLSISFCAHFSVHSGECLRSSCSLALASTTTARL